MSPNKSGIAVCDCQPLRDMAMRMREVPAWTWVGVCVPLAFVCTIFNAIYFSSITVFHDISKQIQLRARTGEIFARWPLAIAINSNKYFYRRIGIKALRKTNYSHVHTTNYRFSKHFS